MSPVAVPSVAELSLEEKKEKVPELEQENEDDEDDDDEVDGDVAGVTGEPGSMCTCMHTYTFARCKEEEEKEEA
jgi:hypothetical protein